MSWVILARPLNLTISIHINKPASASQEIPNVALT